MKSFKKGDRFEISALAKHHFEEDFFPTKTGVVVEPPDGAGTCTIRFSGPGSLASLHTDWMELCSPIQIDKDLTLSLFMSWLEGDEAAVHALHDHLEECGESAKAEQLSTIVDAYAYFMSK